MLKISEKKKLIVQNISKTTLDFETKLKLKSLGPARPQKLYKFKRSVVIRKLRPYTRNFNMGLYNAVEWLVGAKIRMPIFVSHI